MQFHVFELVVGTEAARGGTLGIGEDLNVIDLRAGRIRADGDYDGVLTMYHDQGQIATKLKGFNRGVTVTGGLRTVFTTPAHGTAFDIVGKGVATTGALEEAVRLCARLASGRKDKASLAHAGTAASIP